MHRSFAYRRVAHKPSAGSRGFFGLVGCLARALRNPNVGRKSAAPSATYEPPTATGDATQAAESAALFRPTSDIPGVPDRDGRAAWLHRTWYGTIHGVAVRAPRGGQN